MKLIITNIAAYREKDAVMTGISETEVKTFRVPGLYSPKSKFASLNNVLTIIEPTFSEVKGSKHLILKEAELLFSPMSMNLDFNTLTAVSILTEGANKLFDEESRYLIYQNLFQALIALKNKINPYLISLKYLTDIMNMTGYELSVNHCVRCGKKEGIVAFSFQEGGFLCKNCLIEGDTNDLSVPEMKLFRNLYIYKGYDFKDFKYDEKVLVSLLKKIYIFILDAYGVRINAINNL